MPLKLIPRRVPPSRFIAAGAVLAGAAIFLGITAGSWPGALAAAKAEYRHGAEPIEAYVYTGIWWATLLNALLLTGAILTARWWARPLPPIPSDIARVPRDAFAFSNRTIIIALFVVMLLGAWLRLPRMDVSLYFDELHGIRHYSLGRHDLKDDGSVKFRKATWVDTFWKDRESNNHVLFSITSRLYNETWQRLGNNRATRFSKPALRVPSLVGGLATILVVGFILHELGFSLAGVGAALLLAWHPWHIRYSAEARGYALNMFFVALMTLFLIRALRRGHWRDWAVYGFAQFAALYSYAGSVYVPLALNGVALTTLLVLALRRSAYPAWIQLGRLAITCLFSAILFIQFFAPCVIQISEFLQRDYISRAPGSAFLLNTLAQLGVGMRWFDSDPGNPLHVNVSNAGLFLKIYLLGVVPLALAAGIYRLGHRGAAGVLGALALALPAPLAFFHAVIAKNHIYPWYFIFALPGVVAVSAIGFTSIGHVLAGRKRSPIPSVIVLTAGLAWFILATANQRAVIRNYGKTPLKAVVQHIYGDIDPYADEARQIRVAGLWTAAGIYAPYIRGVSKPEELTELMTQSLADGEPFYFIYGQLARSRTPGIFDILDDPALFTHVETFWGFDEAQFNQHVLVFTGNAAAVETLRNEGRTPQR